MKANRFSVPKLLIKLLITAVVGLVYYYFMLPPINPHAWAFYGFLAVLLLVYIALTLLFSHAFSRGMEPREAARSLRRNCLIPLLALAAILLFAIIGALISSVFFHSDAYSRLLVPEEGAFTEDISEISFDHIPLLDSDSAGVLANRKLGELSDLVSQFEVADSTAQINYHGTPVRVTYLNYGDFFKWVKNNKNGIPAYLTIDMATQEVTVNRLEKGIRYSPSEYFFRDIDRYLRFHYPTLLFTDTNFEIDESGTPFWVATVTRKTIGLLGGEDVKGAVLVNAVTGESTYYDVADVPTWVDRVYTAELLIEQYNYHGRFQNGFWNAFFGQTGCTITTDGYNYIANNDDVWLYTGITSVSGDQGNIGFILVNQRTKQARFYPISGAEEFSAMSSAEGAVQQFSYVATFPLLLNISDQPTYFMALKDASNLVKMYAMVNVSQYQIVATGSSVAACQENYKALLAANNLSEETPAVAQPQYETVSGRIAEIRSAVLNGNTYYYLQLEGADTFYRVSAASAEIAVVLNPGDRVELQYAVGDGDILNAVSLSRK